MTTTGHIYIECPMCGAPDLELAYEIHGDRYAALGLDIELGEYTSLGFFTETCGACGQAVEVSALPDDEWERLADAAVEDAR